MAASGRSKIEEGLVSIKIFDHSFRSMKRRPETETAEKERKIDVVIFRGRVRGQVRRRT